MCEESDEWKGLTQKPLGLGITRGCRREWGGAAPTGAGAPGQRERCLRWLPGDPSCRRGEEVEKEQPEGEGRRSASGRQVCGRETSQMHNQADMCNDVPRCGCANVFTDTRTEV